MTEIKFSKAHELKEDKLVEWIAVVKRKSHEFRKNIFVGLIGILVLLALVFFFRWDRQHKANEAAQLFGKSVVLFQQEKSQSAVDTLQKIYKEYAGTSAASKSVFILANLDYQNGNYDNAVKFYEMFENEYGHKDFLHAAALKGLGACYEQKKDYTRAVSVYARIQKDFSRDFSIPEVLLKMAHCYMKMDKPEKAKSLCEEVIRNHEKSIYIPQAKLLLNSL